ncbi:hypothetical protein Droror1_Dr00011842 [Drosera rotundifolia]
MYKSKLQEFCQSKSWPLPEYTTSSEGPPHDPRFKAVVVVSGVSYETEEEAKSRESAQNEAARIAYERLNVLSPQFSPALQNASSSLSPCYFTVYSTVPQHLQPPITDQSTSKPSPNKIPKFQLQALASSGAHLASSEISLFTKILVATQTPTALLDYDGLFLN